MALLQKTDSLEMMAEINITPFTDILLVLLIIFMILAALVAPPGFERRLPNCRDCNPTHAVTAPPKPLLVTVSARGDIFIASSATDAGHIYGDLRAALAARKAHAISVEADRGAPYGSLLRILDAAKAANNADVTLVTE